MSSFGTTALSIEGHNYILVCKNVYQFQKTCITTTTTILYIRNQTNLFVGFPLTNHNSLLILKWTDNKFHQTRTVLQRRQNTSYTNKFAVCNKKQRCFIRFDFVLIKYKYIYMVFFIFYAYNLCSMVYIHFIPCIFQVHISSMEYLYIRVKLSITFALFTLLSVLKVISSHRKTWTS